MSLSWERPKSDGGGRILGYFIEKKDANSDNWVRINPATPSPPTIFNVPNLIEDREYDFRVFAMNEAGESKPTATGRRIKVKDPKGIRRMKWLFIGCSPIAVYGLSCLVWLLLKVTLSTLCCLMMFVH